METVFITGADRGIGKSMAEEFLSHGYRVFAGQYMPAWPELDKLKEQYPDALTIIPLDVSSTDSVKTAYELTRNETRQIDMLVNVAGIIGNMSLPQMRQVYSVNAVGFLRMTDVFLPLMRNGKKRICVVSSEAGSISLSDRDDMEGWLSYCSSKAMLNMALRLVFNKLNQHGFSFRAYHPGGVNGYMSGQKSTTSDYEPEEAGRVGVEQFIMDRPFEDVLLLTDIENTVWSF